MACHFHCTFSIMTPIIPLHFMVPISCLTRDLFPRVLNRFSVFIKWYIRKFSYQFILSICRFVLRLKTFVCTHMCKQNIELAKKLLFNYDFVSKSEFPNFSPLFIYFKAKDAYSWLCTCISHCCFVPKSCPTFCDPNGR